MFMRVRDRLPGVVLIVWCVGSWYEWAFWLQNVEWLRLESIYGILRMADCGAVFGPLGIKNG